MKGSRSKSFDPATLPAGLRSHGRPLSVHRFWGDTVADVEERILAPMLGENWRSLFSNVRFQRAAAFGAGAVALVGGLVCVWVYLYRPPKEEDRIFVLFAAGMAFLFGLVLFGCGLFARSSEGGAQAGPRRTRRKAGPDLYLVYSDGLATVTGDTFEFMAWKEVKEVANVWMKMNRQLVVRSGDDRELIVWDGYTETGELCLAICQRVSELLLPGTLSRIAEGKSVRFDPFTLHRSGLKYKDRKARWDDIKSMKIVNHRGDVRLTIHTKGRLLAWCWCDIFKISNWDTFYDALCRTAPEDLLTKSKRPRW